MTESTQKPGAAGVQVGYDDRAITINRERTLLLSGAIHYPRSTPAMWPDLIKRSKEAGLNCIETCVFWNLHEAQRGVYDFAGRLDLHRFCELAGEYGLWVILRVGPYIGAETNYGGFPAWLRDLPGMRMRTDNAPFKREVERWVRIVCHLLGSMFAPRGGPIVMVQLDSADGHIADDHGEETKRYLQWVADLGSSLQLGVPLIMGEGAPAGMLGTIAGFWGQEQIETQRAARPDQPVLWTANWPGWYDTWGSARHERTPQTVAYSVARFFAAGGTAMNYYMWHGGTNLGREATYLQTTEYFGGAPLDEYGCETTRSNHLARLHGILREYADVLLRHPLPQVKMLGEKQPLYTWGAGSGDGRELSFYCNDSADDGARVEAEGRMYHLPARSVTLVSGDKVLMSTAQIESSNVIQRAMRPVEKSLSKFLTWPEPLPGEWPEGAGDEGVTADGPVEQLKITRDQTDYCWYSTSLPIDAGQAREGVLTVSGVGDVVYLFLNGVLAGSTKPPLAERRGAMDGDGFKQTFPLKLRPLVNRLSFLCCSLGLIQGEEMIGGQNMVEEKKGIWGGLLWNGQPVAPQPWTMQPGLLGERYRLFSQPGGMATWKPITRAASGKPLHWYRTTFDRPAADGADAPLALDLTGMNKGLAWLNGQCLGRYWLIDGAAEERQQFILDGGVTATADGPTQRYYHLPGEWLKAKNTVVLFEELGGDPTGVKLCRWK